MTKTETAQKHETTPVFKEMLRKRNNSILQMQANLEQARVARNGLVEGYKQGAGLDNAWIMDNNGDFILSPQNDAS